MGDHAHQCAARIALRTCRERMEGWLEENCERGIVIKGMIMKLQAAVREKKRRSAKA